MHRAEELAAFLGVEHLEAIPGVLAFNPKPGDMKDAILEQGTCTTWSWSKGDGLLYASLAWIVHVCIDPEHWALSYELASEESKGGKKKPFFEGISAEIAAYAESLISS